MTSQSIARFAQLAFAIAFAWAAATVSNAQTAEKHLEKCDASFGKGEYAEAVKHCTRALDARPEYEEALMTRAAAYAKLKDHALALNDYNELVRLTNGMAMFHYLRGKVHGDNNSFEYAVVDFTEALKADPKGRYAARSHYERGLIFERKGRTLEAQADFHAAIALDPNLSEARDKIPAAAAGTPVASPVPTSVPTPAATPTPVPVPAATAIPAASPAATASPSPAATASAKPPVSAAAAAVPLGHLGNKDAQPLFDKGVDHLRAKRYDAALASFREALSKYPAGPAEAVVDLINKVDIASIYEQIAAAQLAKGEMDAALKTYKDSLNAAFMALSAAYQSISSKRPKSYGQYADIAKTLMDADIAMVGLLSPWTVRIDALGRRYIESIQNAKLPDDKMLASFEIGVIKLGAGELGSIVLRTVAELRLANAEICRTKLPSKCGASSSVNQVDEYARSALADMDQAIAIAPAVKENYALRAKIHRFIGRTDLAAADEAQAR